MRAPTRCSTLIMAFALAALVVSCSEKGKNSGGGGGSVMFQLDSDVDLTAGGMAGIVIRAPKNSKAKPNSFDKRITDVTDGLTFNLWVKPSAYDLATEKSLHKDDKPKFIKDEANLLFIESDGFTGDRVFSFVANVEVGDKTLGCRNVGGVSLDQATAETLLKSCQSLKAK